MLSGMLGIFDVTMWRACDTIMIVNN